MIPVSRLVRSVRYALKDMQGTGVSDYEIIEALNRAADLLFHRFAARFIYAGLKRTALIVGEEKSAVLPSDFHSLKRLSAEDGRELPQCGFRIAGDEVFTEPGAYGLEYWYLPAEVADTADLLDAPQSVSPWLEQMASAILGGDTGAALSAAEACCASLAAGEVSRFPETGPVSVLGGKL